MDRPRNILWIQTDEQRPDSLGCYGSDWAKTPHIDQLAAEGALFETCVCQAPVCMPSRSSQIFARYPQTMGCLSNESLDQPVAEDGPSIPERLEALGYQTASFGKRHTMRRPLWRDGEEFILDFSSADFYGLPEPYEEAAHRVIKRPGGDPIILAGSYPEGREDPATYLTNRALDYIGNRDVERPFFVRINHIFPHTPVLPPKPWEDTYTADELPIQYFDPEAVAERPEYDKAKWANDRMDQLSKAEVDQMWRDYMGLCAFVDSEVGRTLQALDAMGLLDDTLILFSSDHGKSLGEFGTGEKDVFDDPVWRVPMIWRCPGLVPAGHRDRAVCGLIDTGRTLFGLLGLDDEVPEQWAGRNLFKDAGNGWEFGLIRPIWLKDERRPICFRAAARSQNARLDITVPVSLERLPVDELDGGFYQLDSDPLEKRNRFHEPAFRDEVQAHIDKIYEWLETHRPDPRLSQSEWEGKLYY